MDGWWDQREFERGNRRDSDRIYFLGSKCKPIYNSSIERLSRGENRRRIRVYVFHNGWVKNKRALSRVDFLEN